MPYDRVKALDYAKTHWDNPCDDGVVWLSSEAINVARKRRELSASEADGWLARFRPDGTGGEKFVFERVVGGVREEKLINPWEGLADCAHFLSRSLSAGGATTDERGVGALVNTLMGRSDTKTICERVSKAGGQRVIDAGLLKPGDMIGYFNISPTGDYGGARRYTHSTMFCGKTGAAGDIGHVTCHTKSRFMGLTPAAYTDEWYLDNDYEYTFIHFTAGDAAIAPTGKTLEGWWTITYAARTEYYYIRSDGRAYYTLRKPTNKSQVLTRGSAEGSAYYFVTAPTITFCWRKTGTVETWLAAPFFDNLFGISVNGTPGTAVRTF